MCNLKTHIKDSNHHRTKYQESGNLNIAETRGTVAETQRLTRVSVSGYVAVSHVSVAAFSTEPEHFFSRFQQISVSGITYFRNRYHVNKLRKREITFGNKFVSFSFFGGNVELRSGYVSFFFLFLSVSVALTTSMSLKNYLHTQKVFPGGFGEKRNYGGFQDRDQWPKRTSQEHRRHAYRVKNCVSESAAEKLASELLYYASVEMCIIDPMHNLFLGTAKRVFTKWVEDDIITKTGLETIQTRINEITVLSDIGRLPGNIKSNYGGFTAAQWKNFVLLFSMYCLKDVLPDQHLHYWQSFVLACCLLCRSCITKTDLMLADCKLMHFVKEYEKINGEMTITPNMHLHLHLKECVENYGSIYGFWLFSFERYNGILGSCQTNNKTVELQIMRKFMTSGILGNMQ